MIRIFMFWVLEYNNDFLFFLWLVVLFLIFEPRVLQAIGGCGPFIRIEFEHRP